MRKREREKERKGREVEHKNDEHTLVLFYEL